MGTEEMWPYLLAFSGVPALLQFVTLLFFPEAPRHLYIDKGDTEGACKGERTQTFSRQIYRKIFACKTLESGLDGYSWISESQKVILAFRHSVFIAFFGGGDSRLKRNLKNFQT